MKKIFAAAVLSVAITSAFCQNVGIGTATPFTKLTVSGEESTPNGVGTAISIFNNAPGGGAWYMRAGATGTATPAAGFSIADNNAYWFNINNAGYIGLNTLAPAERLHLESGNIRMANTLKGIILNGADRPFITRGFDTFTTGNYTGLGRWGLFMEPSRLTLGIPNMPGKAFEIAKYELNGNRLTLMSVDVNGALQVGGSTGSTGQVLTSNGSSAPSWQTLAGAFDNNTRFEASFSGSGSSSAEPALSYSTIYNTNTADVTITATGITINKTGLYHIEGYFSSSVTFTGAAPVYIQQSFSLNVNARFYQHAIRTPLERDMSNSISFGYRNFTRHVNEVYIVAPATITPDPATFYSLPGGSSLSSANNSGRISGYLISE
jgi:hypothetical protein